MQSEQDLKRIFTIMSSQIGQNAISTAELFQCLRILGLVLSSKDEERILTNNYLKPSSLVNFKTFSDIYKSEKALILDFELLSQCLAQFDCEGLGLLDKPLIKSLLTHYGEKMPSQNLEAIFTLLDSSTDKIDYNKAFFSSFTT